MCCANTTIDIEAVRGSPFSDDVCAKFMKNIRRNMVRRTVGAVDVDPHALEIDLLADRRLAEFDVAARRIVKAPGFAEVLRFNAGEAFVDLLLDLKLPLVGKLLTGARKEFDAVVVVRVVARVR